MKNPEDMKWTDYGWVDWGFAWVSSRADRRWGVMELEPGLWVGMWEAVDDLEGDATGLNGLWESRFKAQQAVEKLIEAHEAVGK